MDIFLDPNIAYVILVVSLMLTGLALLSPGTGILEVGALFALLLAGYAVFQLPLNMWALAVLLVGMVLFILSVRRPRQERWLAAAILALVAGSAFLFRSEELLRPAVNPVLALVVSAATAGFSWIAVRKILEAGESRPSHDLGALLGQLGEARTVVEDINEGSVYVNGELWSARSRTPIPAGSRVRVVGRDGLILLVEPENPAAASVVDN
jgi:membrane-bound serine protease (ClpP class)